MLNIYNQEMDNECLNVSLTRIVNQIFKLLPTYEEEQDWCKPLETLTIEVSGLAGFFPKEEELFMLACKMKGLLENPDIEFMPFRRTIFECCSLASRIKERNV